MLEYKLWDATRHEGSENETNANLLSAHAGVLEQNRQYKVSAI